MKKTVRAALCALLCLLTALSATGCGGRGPANTVYSAEDTSGKIIGVLYGTSSAPYAGELGEAVVYSSSAQLMDALKSGALDCVIMEKLPGDKLAKKTLGVKTLAEPLLEYDLSFAIAKENADLTRAVNAALSTLDDNGTIKGLYDKYFKGGRYVYSPPSGAPAPDGFLTLAVPGDYPPYSYKNEEGEYEGFDVEIARAVCSILGVELRITAEEMPKLVTSVRFGKADFALGGVHMNEADAELVDFSVSYGQLVQVILVRT